MLTQEQVSLIDQLFPVLTGLEPKVRQVLFAAGQIVDLPVGQMLMQQNQQCRFIPLVLTGQLRIFKLSPGGREMTLYRTGPGDTCLLSIACQLKDNDFPALAQVEEAARLFMLPAAVYHDVLDILPAWKDFLILTLYRHLTESMETLESIAFSRTDHRLAAWLLARRSEGSPVIRCTHEAIAIELGTAREVISRLLGELKNQGIVSLGRGKIEIIRPVDLEALSQD
ncbi:MAG: Crp/Fnr family transcriptional regulator [Clostridiaceae bacterium]|nr:Crp/Fnr family transcriptional regulator [Clostridiaceae bacterium]